MKIKMISILLCLLFLLVSCDGKGADLPDKNGGDTPAAEEGSDNGSGEEKKEDESGENGGTEEDESDQGHQNGDLSGEIELPKVEF